MPSASNELREKMNDWFSDRIDDAGPRKFLTDAGYRLVHGWAWEPKPGVQTLNDMTEKEWLCMKFLVDEWDFRFLANEGKKQ